MFKSCLPEVSATPMFFIDKDFEYMRLLKVLFPGCILMLCKVHVYRYMKEKVFSSAVYSDGKTF